MFETRHNAATDFGKLQARGWGEFECHDTHTKFCQHCQIQNLQGTNTHKT